MNLFWLFFIVRIAYNIAFAKVTKDVRSDDEESDEEKEGERGQKGIAEREPKEKKANGVAANGKAPEHHADVVVENKKER